jgi:hypothetical protein
MQTKTYGCLISIFHRIGIVLKIEFQFGITSNAKRLRFGID